MSVAPDEVLAPSEASLLELANRANDEHALARQAGESMVEHAIRSGEALIAAKAQVAHGEWLPWLEANFEASQQTASDYVRLARNYQRAGNLEEPSIRKALAALTIEPSEPKPPVDPIPPPDGKYRCIVIDPPWPMPKIEREVRPNQGAYLDYPTLMLEQIADEDFVPVRTAADDDCHIYLWVTHKFLPHGLELLDGWGFKYQCVLTWRKNVGITPFSWMYDTEHVLFGRKGNLPLAKNGLRLSIDAKAAGHSIKPDAFYERVLEASPGPRLDMFPGVEHDGFEPWGLEASHRV